MSTAKVIAVRIATLEYDATSSCPVVYELELEDYLRGMGR
jgi:hypothetical protein